MSVRYEKVSDNNWTMKLFDDTNTQIGGTVNLQFDPASGHLVAPTTVPTFTLTPTTSGADPFTFSVDLGSGNDGLHQYGGTTVVSLRSTPYALTRRGDPERVVRQVVKQH